MYVTTKGIISCSVEQHCRLYFLLAPLSLSPPCSLCSEPSSTPLRVLVTLGTAILIVVVTSSGEHKPPTGLRYCPQGRSWPANLQLVCSGPTPANRLGIVCDSTAARKMKGLKMPLSQSARYSCRVPSSGQDSMRESVTRAVPSLTSVRDDSGAKLRAALMERQIGPDFPACLLPVRHPWNLPPLGSSFEVEIVSVSSLSFPAGKPCGIGGGTSSLALHGDALTIYVYRVHLQGTR